MKNHADKRRDMARPMTRSSVRRGAKQDKTAVKRRSRHAVRQHVRSLHVSAAPHTDVEERFDDDCTDWHEYPDVELQQLARSRRRAQRSAPVARWAIARASRTPEADRLEVAHALIAGTAVGDAARWSVDRHFAAVPTLNRFPHRHYADEDLRVAESVARRVIADGLLAEFNRWMKGHPLAVRDGEGCRYYVRTLAGEHDIASFAHDCRTARGGDLPTGYGHTWVWMDAVQSWVKNAGWTA